MALSSTPLPYGLRDVKVTPYNADGTLGTPLDLPNSRTFSFTEAEDFEELRGDDTVVTVVGKGPAVEWELEAGGLSFEVVKAMFGGEIEVTGLDATGKKTWTKKTTHSRPFFKVEGQSISDNGGDIHCILDKCRATGDFDGEFSDGNFFLTKTKGKALGSTLAGRENIVYQFVQNTTVTAIPTN